MVLLRTSKKRRPFSVTDTITSEVIYAYVYSFGVIVRQAGEIFIVVCVGGAGGCHISISVGNGIF